MNYSVYQLSVRERVKLIMEWGLIAGVIAFFFYRSWIVFLLLVFLVPLYFRYRKKDLIKARKWRITLQFKDALMMVSANLRAGNSVENAFRRSCTELEHLYGKECEMAEEFRVIGRGLDNNLVLENMLLDLAVRTQVEEIADFAEIFAIAKRTVGNLREIISDTSAAIGEKIEMQRELRVLIASKQLEHKIMCLVPFLIIGYIGFTSKGYFDSLYHNVSGFFIMTACLAVYFGALYWGKRITDISMLEG